MGSIIKAFMITPSGPTEKIQKSIPRDTTAAYGKHLVMTIANCNECHTKRDGIGKFVGEPLAGGTECSKNRQAHTDHAQPDTRQQQPHLWLVAGRFYQALPYGQTYSVQPHALGVVWPHDR
jgi:cytochrome c2